MEQFKPDYVKLLDLLGRVNNANEGSSDDERLIDAHWLANKLISHALTVLYLLFHGTNIQDLPSFKSSKLRFVDSASIDVLTRATLESFLVFHYVFFAPTTAKERDYRYLSYKSAGLAEKQSFPTITREARQTLDSEKIVLDDFLDKLKLNEIFQNLKDYQKSKIFKGQGEWKWKPHGKGKVSWYDIAISAGFSKVLARYVYGYLSRHTHSSYLSVIQMRQIFESKEKEQSISAPIMSIVVANMIREYCALFPMVQNVLSRDLEGNNLVEQYIRIGRILDKYMGISRDND